MQAETLAVAAEQPERLHLRVAWLCGVVLFLEGYDIAAVGYAIPSLVDAWRVAPSAFAQTKQQLKHPAAPSKLGPFSISPDYDKFLNELEKANFQFFWEQTNPKTGLVKDRSNVKNADK